MKPIVTIARLLALVVIVALGGSVFHQRMAHYPLDVYSSFTACPSPRYLSGY